MQTEILLALISKLIDERLQEIPPLRGPKGRDGRDGKDAEPVQAFSIEKYSQEIREWIREESLKFNDLDDNQIALLRGSPGRDGKSFIFSENESAINEIILSEIERMSPDLKLKFSDLSLEEISELRGPEGKQGKSGKDFSFEEHREFFESLKLRISDLTETEINEIKLKFSDRTEEEVNQLRGPRGPRGQIGKSGQDFVLEEHLDFFQGLKLKFSDLTEEEVNAIKLKFSDLTDSDKEQLKLRFEHLTEDERISLKGPRGQRGKHGPTGEQGIQGPKGEHGIRGARGPVGLSGDRGYPGLTGRDGVNGRDGLDAPAIVDVDINRNGDKISFTFIFDDGSRIETPEVRLPSSSIGIPGPVGGVGTGPRGPAGQILGGNFILYDVPCDDAVYLGAAVRMAVGQTIDIQMSDWTTMTAVTLLSDQTVETIAVNAKADSYSNSNVIGVVQAKSSSFRCDIRIAGYTDSVYSGLDVVEDYYLSDTVDGGIVISSLAPTASGTVLVRLGQPYDGTRLIYQRGDRLVRS